MKIAGNQPYIFPYIGYFQLINQVDYFISADDYQYIERGWINRNNILVADKPYLITFSVKKDSHNKSICERYYNDKLFIKQYKKLFKLLEFNYKKATYYNDVIELLNRIFSFEDYNVSTFNLNSIKQICKYLDINTKFLNSSDIKKDGNLKRQDKVLEIVEILNANTYINAIGGKMLYSKEKFKERNVDLFFIETNVKGYKQFSQKFVENLSIIDVLMHNSIDEAKELLNQYTLV